MSPKRAKDQNGRPGRSADPNKPPVRMAPFADEEIDLHGLAVDEAMVQVELAIGRHRYRPGACLRIIHGHSSGNQNSIKGALRRNLETKWRSRIRSFRPEPANPGATLILVA